MPKQIKSDLPQESWNKKRLILLGIFLAILIIGGLELRTYYLADNDSRVAGAKISPVPTIVLPSSRNISEGVQNSVLNIKQEIEKINVSEIATSSPQVQKVLNDIKALPAVPGEQAKDMCIKLCNSL